MATHLEDADISSIAKELIENSFDKDKKGVTYLEAITIAMSVVEHISGNKKLSGSEKKELAIKIVPLIIDVLVELGKISKEDGEALKKSYKEQTSLIEEFIEVAIAISKNPSVINAGKWIAREGSKLCKGCVIA